MSYSFESRIRYSEIGEDGHLTLNGIINYFQDCSTFHSEDLGLGLRTLSEDGRVWVLSSWQIVVNRYPALGEYVETVTWPYEFHGFMGKRNFLLKSREGELLAYANTLWVFMDVKRGRPGIIEQKYIDGYKLEPPFEMAYADRKVAVPAQCIEKDAFEVHSWHLDTNHHVNNGQYVQMAAGLLPADFSIGQMRAEYKKQAVLGDTIVPKLHMEASVCTVALCQTDGKPYAVVEFTKKENR